MSKTPLLQRRLFCIGFIALAIADFARSAPAPKPQTLTPFVQFIPDDASFVAIENIKDSPVAKKDKKSLSDDEQQVFVAAALFFPPCFKDFGIKPFEDIERLVVIGAPPQPSDSDPHLKRSITLFQGRFDQDKLRAAADRLVEEKADEKKVKRLNVGQATVYEMPYGLYLYLLDPTTLICAPSKKLLEEVIKKGLDKKPAKPKNARLARWLEELDSSAPINLIALEDSIVGKRSWSDTINGQRVERTEINTLRDGGIEVVQATLGIGSHPRAKVLVEAKSADNAKEVTKCIHKYVEIELEQVEEALKALNLKEKESDQEETELKANYDAIRAFEKGLKSIKILTKGTMISIDGPGYLVTELLTGTFIVALPDPVHEQLQFWPSQAVVRV
ncbi:MAG: hypothetical protein ACJ8FY_02165 [Gemmataceae bacterium]